MGKPRTQHGGDWEQACRGAEVFRLDMNFFVVFLFFVVFVCVFFWCCFFPFGGMSPLS